MLQDKNIGIVKDRRSLNYLLGSSVIKHRVRRRHECSVQDIYSSWWSYVLLLSLSLWCAFVLWFLFDTEDFVLFKVLEWVFCKWELMLNAPLTWLVKCLIRRRAAIYFCQCSLAPGFSDLCIAAGISAIGWSGKLIWQWCSGLNQSAGTECHVNVRQRKWV